MVAHIQIITFYRNGQPGGNGGGAGGGDSSKTGGGVTTDPNHPKPQGNGEGGGDWKVAVVVLREDLEELAAVLGVDVVEMERTLQ